MFQDSFEKNKFNSFCNLLGSPSQELKNMGKLWIRSSLGIYLEDICVKDLFNCQNLKILKNLRKNLKNPSLNWIIVILNDETLVFSLFHNFILCWNVIPKNISSLFLSSIIHNPEILDKYDNNYRIQTYQCGFNVLIKISEITRKLHSQVYRNNSLISCLQKIFYPKTFIESYSQIFHDFEQNEVKNSLFPTKIDINRFINRIERNILDEDKVNLTYVEILDLTPIHLLENPPLKLNMDKIRGQYFTPLELAVPLLFHSFSNTTFRKLSTINGIKKFRILDPASGTGMILIVALEWLINQVLQLDEPIPFDSFLQLRKELFLSSCHGFDIDKQVLTFCKDFLNLFLNFKDSRAKISNNLQNENYLEILANNFQNNISHVHYDLILSNPPYIPLTGRFSKQVVPQHIKSILQLMIPEFIGKRDNLYIMFLGLALKYSSRPNHGLVSFILDHSFLDLSSYSEIRRTLLKHYTLIYLLENYKYKRAVVDLSILIIKNSKNHKDFMSFIGQKGLDHLPRTEPTTYFSDHPNYIFQIYRKAAIHDIINQIDSLTIRLGRISKISCGLEYGSILKSHFLSHKHSSDMYPVIDGSNGIPQSFVIFWVSGMKNSYVRFSKKYEDYLRINNLNRSKAGNKEVILISGEKERFINPKVFLRQTASKFIVSYDTRAFFGLRNLHTIHNIQAPYSPYLIMGILTSTLGNWIGNVLNIIRTAGTDGNRYPQIRIRDIKNFPIINLEKNLQSIDIQRIKQLEGKTKSNIQIGNNISTIYKKIWELVESQSGTIPFRSQKRLFEFCKNPEKSSFLPNKARTELSFLLKDLEMSQSLLKHNQEIIDEIVFKIYRITKEQWEKVI